MRITNRTFFVSAAALLMSISGTACALTKMWRAEVRQSGQVPCFSIESSRDTRRLPTTLAAISVHELDQREVPSRAVWELGVQVGGEGEPPRLSPDACLAYGAQPQAMTARTLPAALELGKRYQVSMNTDLGDGPSSENRRYRAYFCLTRQGDQVLVHDVKWDERAGQRRWGVCDLPSAVR